MYIIKQFIISGILAFIATFGSFIIFFGGLHIISEKQYKLFLSAYNQDKKIMFITVIVILLTFGVFLFLIFMKRMDHITHYISEIGGCVNEIAKGNLTAKIPIRNHNELGELAININRMATDLNEAIEKERTWDKQKYNLITNLSHDLKTPLMSVLGFLELICNQKYESQDMLKHYSEVAFNKASVLKESIDKLFELSKLNNTGIVLHKTNISILEIAEQVLMGFIPIFEEKQMQYGIQDERKQVIINADALLIARLFENLISNAIKYGSEGKRIDIIIDETNEEEVGIQFVNYGNPICKDDLEKLFGRFYRAEKNSEEKEGTGLGLAIAKSIVELHGGSIRVASNEDKTEFTVVLPKQ